MMKNHISLYILLFCLLCISSCGVERNIKRGDKHLALGEYYDAATQYRRAYAKIPAKERETRGRLSLKMAECYDRINNTSRAVASYQNAIRYGQATTEMRLSYGRTLLKSGMYKTAENIFKELLDSLPDNVLAKEGLLSAQTAINKRELGSRYIVKRMDIFNSRRSDYSPMFGSLSHDKLYFSSTRNEAQGNELSGITGTKNADIFVSEKDDRGNWSKPEIVAGGLNTEYDEGTPAFTPDFQTMYVTQCTTNPDYPRYARIMSSARSDAKWNKVADIGLSKDTLSSFAHPAISPDGNWLYFTSDMPGGKGGLDIWRAQITSSGFGGVENLGAPINTEGNEEFPTFRPNGELYFSSDGHQGLGGLDVYAAKVDSSGKYRIEHLGSPLNSNGDDFGLTFEGRLNKGFFSSNRGDARGYDHIYSFELPEIVYSVKGWVYEDEGYELPSSQVYIVGTDGTNKRVGVLPDGSFREIVKANVDYIFLATCKGFLNHKEELSIPKTEESKEYVLQFPLASLTSPMLIDNIFYDFDKYTLLPQSKTSLNALIKVLQENPTVKIELRAHCDYRGSEEYNRQLSTLRAQSVVAYLIENGIEKNRLYAVGYGKDKPKVIKKKLTETYTFLKEGDVLTEEFIQALPANEQDICNGLNRRTEFVVKEDTP